MTRNAVRQPSMLLPTMLMSLCIITGCRDRTIEIGETTVEPVRESTGTGGRADDGDYVTIAYTLSTDDGRTIVEHDEFSFTLGTGVVITGVDEAVKGMRRGGRRTVLVPPQLHWGRNGYGDGKVPPNATLTLDVELLALDAR